MPLLRVVLHHRVTWEKRGHDTPTCAATAPRCLFSLLREQGLSQRVSPGGGYEFEFPCSFLRAIGDRSIRQIRAESCGIRNAAALWGLSLKTVATRYCPRILARRPGQIVGGVRVLEMKLHEAIKSV